MKQYRNDTTFRGESERGDKMNIYYILTSLLVCGLLFGSFYVGQNYAEQNAYKPVKAKVMTLGRCIESDLTIEEYYFQAKLFCSIGLCDKVGRICN